MREGALHFLALGEWSAAHLPDDEETLALWHEAAGYARKALLERLASAVIEEPGLAERICDASHILLDGTFLPLFLEPAEEEEYDDGWEDEEEDPYAEDDLDRPIWEFFFNPLAKSVGQGPYFAVPVYQVDRPGFEVTDGIRTAPENAWRPFFSLFEVE